MPRRYRIPLAGAAVLALLAAFATPAQAQSDATDQRSTRAVAYQISISHDGFSSDTTIKPPLRSRWTHQFPGDGPVSYPLIAGGKVYVTVKIPSSVDGIGGSNLYALDRASGAIVWSQRISNYYWSNAAYDRGHVFVVDSGGRLREFDASTGAPGWSMRLPGQYGSSSPPTADNGVVYVGGSGYNGTLYAVSETDGSVLWMQPVHNGDFSSPALSATGVYVSYACGLTYGFDRATGQQRWFSNGPCSGGGGITPTYHDGKVYTVDYWGNKILDAGTGALLGTFQSDAQPVFAGKVGLFMDRGTLQAVADGGILWTFTGDGQLDTLPIVVGDTVYIRSSRGMIYGLGLDSGEVVWSANAGAQIFLSTGPVTGLGAGQGLLVVPAGNKLAAYSD